MLNALKNLPLRAAVKRASPAPVPAEPIVDAATGRLRYLDSFGLRGAPFQATPNTDFFCGAGGRAVVLYELLARLRLGAAVVTLTGESGTGKTVLARMLRSCAPRAMDVLFLAKPARWRGEFVALLADELGVEVSFGGSDGRTELRAALQRRCAEGRWTVLVVDDAHRLPQEVLQDIVSLAAPSDGARPALSLLLLGPDGLRASLDACAAGTGLDGTPVHLQLERLPELEAVAYLAHRMLRAGGSASTFDGPAALRIARGAMGISARINVLADKSLMAAWLEGAPQVGLRHVELALNDSAFRALRASAGDAAPRSTALGRMWRRYGLGRIGPA